MNVSSFSIAAFDPTGALIGIGDKSFNKLSDRWLNIAATYLSENGENFKSSWKNSLAHLTTQFTSTDGVALVTFYANGYLVTSLALFSGKNETAEKSVLQMFVNSLRKTEVVKNNAETETPFNEVFNITARPLMVVIPWADDKISQQDHGLVQELAIHLSGAFFLRE